MGVKYVKDFAFPSAGGFHSGSVQRYAKGGHVTKLPAKAKDSAKGMPARAKPNAPARGAPKMESKPSRGKRQGYERGGPVMELDSRQPDYVPSRSRAAQVNASAPREDIGDIIGVVGGLTPLPEEPIYRERISPALEREDVGAIIGVAPEAPRYLRPEPVDRVAARRAAMMERAGARRMGRVPAFAKGGAVKDKKIAKVMREYKEGKLHSGSKKGPVVKNPKQAMAIALSEARAARKAEGGLTSYEESGSAGGSSVGFKEAFRKAREQGLKEFSWKGDRYSTKLKEETKSESKVSEEAPKAEAGRKGPSSRGGKRNVSEMSEYKRERKMELPSDRGTSYRSQGDDTGMSASERAGKAREYAMDIATAGAFGKAFKGPVKDLAKGAMRKASEFVGGRKLKQAAAERAAREATPEYKSKAAQMEKFAKEMRARQKMGAKYAEGGEVMSKGPKTRYTAAKGRRQSRERAMEKWAEQRMKHAEMYAPGKSLDMSEYAKGGAAKHSDVKMDKAMVKKAVHKHEKAMHPGKPMTKLNKGGVPSYGRKAMYGGGKC
jgi:hypothetical protein